MFLETISRHISSARPPSPLILDRFDAVRGRADVRWRTGDLMKLLRAGD